jgi:hypothetical protein
MSWKIDVRLSDLLRDVATLAERQNKRRGSLGSLLEFKAAFPRKDLIKWVDSNTPPEGDEAEYILGMILMFARQLLYGDLIEVRVASRDDFARKRLFPTASTHDCYLNEGQATPFDPFELMEHCVGLITGIFTSGDNVEQIGKILTIRAPHAIRCLFMTDEIYNSLNYNENEIKFQGFPIFQGALIKWEGNTWHVVCRGNRKRNGNH